MEFAKQKHKQKQKQKQTSFTNIFTINQSLSTNSRREFHIRRTSVNCQHIEWQRIKTCFYCTFTSISNSIIHLWIKLDCFNSRKVHWSIWSSVFRFNRERININSICWTIAMTFKWLKRIEVLVSEIRESWCSITQDWWYSIRITSLIKIHSIVIELSNTNIIIRVRPIEIRFKRIWIKGELRLLNLCLFIERIKCNISIANWSCVIKNLLSTRIVS